jgi:MFS family permease
MLGAACGGILLGNLGDRIGRTRAMAISIIIYSVFAGLGAYVRTQEQMCLTRFLVGMGTGGMLPNGIALVAECWPSASRPLISGIMGAGINLGFLILSQIVRVWPLEPDSWRWFFKLSALPAIVGLFALVALPESPAWVAHRRGRKAPSAALSELFRPPLRRATVLGILLGAIPLLGGWAASKWMIPWADQVATTSLPAYKATVQQWWAIGATVGALLGAQVAGWGRRSSYFVISLCSVLLTSILFWGTAPLRPSFLPVVCAQGFITTLFFGWLPLYLPELFPTRARASGMGLSYNVGRFATALGILLAGNLFVALGESYPNVGFISGLVYALGMIVIWWAPDTKGRSLSPNGISADSCSE